MSSNFKSVTGPAHGSLDGTGRNRTYRPDADYYGTDSFVFTAHDGIVSSAPATVTIEIRPAYDAAGALPGSIATNEDEPVAIQLRADNPDGAVLAFEIVEPPTHGTLTGAPPALTYTPQPDFDGTDRLTFRVRDGLAISEPAEFLIAVRPINDPPHVEAGPAQSLAFPAFVRLEAQVTDDQTPTGAAPSVQWTQVSGTGVVNFGNPLASQTVAVADKPGTYRLRIEYQTASLPLRMNLK